MFKHKNKIYILFKNYYFNISFEKNSLEKCKKPNIYFLDVGNKGNYNKNEFDLCSMEDIYNNPLIYLYKIYFLGDNLVEKNKIKSINKIKNS